MSGGSKKTHGPSWEERGAHAACWERVLPTPLLWDSLSPSVPIKGLNLLCGGGELLALSWACLDPGPCPPSPDIGFEQTFPAGSGAGDSTQMAAPGSATGDCS